MIQTFVCVVLCCMYVDTVGVVGCPPRVLALFWPWVRKTRRNQRSSLALSYSVYVAIGHQSLLLWESCSGARFQFCQCGLRGLFTRHENYVCVPRPRSPGSRIGLRVCCAPPDVVVFLLLLDAKVGALNPERLAEFIDRYRSFDDPDIPGFMYGSHYSTAVGVVLHYLVRLQPFADLHREMQVGGECLCEQRHGC